MPTFKPNPTIGRIPCSQRNCSQQMEVKKYAQRTSDPKMQRYAGKLYAVCPAGHRTNDQEYILEQPGAVSASKASEPAPARSAEIPQKPAEIIAPATAPAAVAAAKKKPFFPTLLDDDDDKPAPTLLD